ncbi:Rhamnogalacturonide transporter RhiT [Klebsiella pneumoniae subsp. pneumoniae]|nr:Rhamnogalacturonide transporter RhiT [Klebsiella pneumoniae subsp. pneumoniae]
MKTRKIGLANYLAYGAGDFLGAGTTALTAAWLLYFYTTFCGLTPIEATLIFAAAPRAGRGGKPADGLSHR